MAGAPPRRGWPVTAAQITDLVLKLVGSGGALGVIALFFRLRGEGRLGKANEQKARADAAKTLTDAAAAMVAPLQAQIDGLTSKLAAASEALDRSEVKLRATLAELEESRARTSALLRRVAVLELYIDELISTLRNAKLPVPILPDPVDKGLR